MENIIINEGKKKSYHKYIINLWELINFYYIEIKFNSMNNKTIEISYNINHKTIT